MRSFPHSDRSRGPRPPHDDSTYEPGRPLGRGPRDHGRPDRDDDGRHEHDGRDDQRGRRGPGRRGPGFGGPGFGGPGFGGPGFDGPRPGGPSFDGPGVDAPDADRPGRGGRGFGGPGFGGPRGGRGDGGPEGRGRRGPGRGSRAGRGDIRGAVLMLLQESPMHGYQIIQEITTRSGERWSPSPGAIYPALNLLEDEGLITITADSGRKLATLTPEGEAYVTAHAEALGTPWQQATGRAAHPARALREAMEALGVAAHQIARTGSEQQAAQALTTLEKARRELYLVLAGETVHATEPAGTAGPSTAPGEAGAAADAAAVDGTATGDWAVTDD